MTAKYTFQALNKHNYLSSSLSADLVKVVVSFLFKFFLPRVDPGDFFLHICPFAVPLLLSLVLEVLKYPRVLFQAQFSSYSEYLPGDRPILPMVNVTFSL